VQDPGSLYSLDVDRPFEIGHGALHSRFAAMEGTVLRVPCQLHERLQAQATAPELSAAWFLAVLC
jgi:hypothetical protein